MRRTLPFLLLAASACSHAPVSTGAEQLPQLPRDKTAVVLPILFESRAPLADTGCWLILSPEDGVATYRITLKTGKEYYATELPEGAYRVKLFQCGGDVWRLTRKKWPAFRAYPGKLAMAGGLHLEMGADLKLGSHLVNRRTNVEDARSFFGRLGEQSRDQVVSAYTGQPLAPRLVDAPARWGRKHWAVEPKRPASEGKGEEAQAWWPRLGTCYDGEELVNGLWLGGLEVRATYRGRKLEELDLGSREATFTPHFSECVKAQLREFEPPGAELLSYRLEL
jgi:hypothetical protein